MSGSALSIQGKTVLLCARAAFFEYFYHVKCTGLQGPVIYEINHPIAKSGLAIIGFIRLCSHDAGTAFFYNKIQ